MGVADQVSGAFGNRTQLSEPEIHDVLRNERRRETLRCLRSHAGEAHLDDLTNTIVRREGGTAPESSDLRRSVYSSLHQTHLPKLDTVGVINFDRRRGSVELNGKAEDVFQYMSYTPERNLFWSRVYLAVAVLSGFSVLLLASGIGPFGTIPTATLAILITGVFGILSLVQMRQSTNHETVEKDTSGH